MKIDVPRRSIEIVIVDDSPELIRVYEEYFQIAGLKIIAKFSNAYEMLSRFSSSGASFADSIVLLDFTMPKMDGIEAARQLKQLNPNQKIILATVGDQSNFKAEDKMFDATIRKPFTISELLATIEKVTLPIQTKGSWIFGTDDVNRKYQEILSDSKERVCMCLSSVGVKRRLDVPSYIPYYVRAKSRGLKVMLVTEVTRDNLFYCKELMMNRGIEVRHLGGVEMNFSVWDEKHTLEAVLTSDSSTVLKKILYSNIESIVNKNQFLFDQLWSEAVPAEKKIRELEAAGGGESKEVTLITGAERINAVRIGVINNARSSLEVCSIIDNHIQKWLPRIREAWIEAVKRGVCSRQITKVTKENIPLCKAMMEMGMELRHVNDLQGGFLVNETEILSVATRDDSVTGLKYVYSNFPLIVEQHRSIFKNLWNAAIPASTRIKEIEDRQEKEIRNN